MKIHRCIICGGVLTSLWAIATALCSDRCVFKWFTKGGTDDGDD